MRQGALILAAAMLLPAIVRAADVPAPLAAARKQVESADYRMSGHMAHVDASGARTTDNVEIKAHWFPGVLRVLIAVTSPANARVHVLLEMRPGGESTIHIAHPGDAEAAILPFDRWSEGPLGDGFSYEDFLESSYFWSGQASLGAVKYGARSCQLLKSTPGAADKTHDAEVKSWLDSSSSFPVYVEKTMKGSGLVKGFTYFGLRRSEGVWWASQVQEKIRGHADSTFLIIDHGSPKAHLGEKDFSTAQLTHFQD